MTRRWRQCVVEGCKRRAMSGRMVCKDHEGTARRYEEEAARRTGGEADGEMEGGDEGMEEEGMGDGQEGPVQVNERARWQEAYIRRLQEWEPE